jgi:hypothetical protein
MSTAPSAMTAKTTTARPAANASSQLTVELENKVSAS